MNSLLITLPFLKVQEYNLTISQRGVGRGQWGEGFTGATIKDKWTKSRGRVEAGEGGGFGWGGELSLIHISEPTRLS